MSTEDAKREEVPIPRPSPKTRKSKAKAQITKKTSSLIADLKRMKRGVSTTQSRAAFAQKLDKRLSMTGGEDTLQLISNYHRNASDNSTDESFSGWKCVVLPHTLVRAVWDMGILVSLLYVVIVVPMELGFRISVPPAVSLVVDIVFMCDVALNFFTAYISASGKLVTSHPKIVYRYLKGYFFFDLLSSLPYSLLSVAANEGGALTALKTSKVARLLSSLRWLNMSKLTRIRLFGPLLEDIRIVHRHTTKMVGMLMLATLTFHVNACLFAWTSQPSEGANVDGPPTDSWLGANDLLSEEVSMQYVSALYWSVSAITTVGFGDIVPITLEERIYCIFAVLLGAAAYAAMVSVFVADQASGNISQKRTNERLDLICAYMRSKSFPRGLYRKVFRYYHHYYQRKTAFDEVQIMSELSDSLRNEVLQFLAYAKFNDVDILKGFKVKYQMLFHLITKPVRVQGAEVVYEAGQIGKEMYIIVTGSVKLQSFDGRGRAGSPKELTHHCTFGERCTLGLIKSRRDTATALEITELLSIEKTDVLYTLSEQAPHVLIDLRQRVKAKYDSKTVVPTQPGKLYQTRSLLASMGRRLSGSPLDYSTGKKHMNSDKKRRASVIPLKSAAIDNEVDDQCALSKRNTERAKRRSMETPDLLKNILQKRKSSWLRSNPSFRVDPAMQEDIPAPPQSNAKDDDDRSRVSSIHSLPASPSSRTIQPKVSSHNTRRAPRRGSEVSPASPKSRAPDGSAAWTCGGGGLRGKGTSRAFSRRMSMNMQGSSLPRVPGLTEQAPGTGGPPGFAGLGYLDAAPGQSKSDATALVEEVREMKTMMMATLRSMSDEIADLHKRFDRLEQQ